MSIATFKIGTRLAGGFGALLLLLALSVTVGSWRLSDFAAATEAMMATPLAKERLVAEWSRNVAAGVRRTAAIAKSSDASLEGYFAAEVKESTVRGNEIAKALEAWPRSPEETQALADLTGARQAYLDVRNAVMQAKREGRAEEANRLFDAQFTPRSNEYIARMQAYLDFQQAAIDRTAKDIEHAASQGRNTLIAIGSVALLLGVALATLLTQSITRPIGEAKRVADAVAQGRLGHRMDIRGRDELAALMTALSGMDAGLCKLVASVRASTDTIGTASSQIAAGSQDLSSRTEQAASSLQQTASSMEQLTGTVGQSSESARQADQLARSAAEVAAKGGGLITQVVATMDDIQQSSRRIADITGVIDGIAFQTNILALNAAVEAARAGEQGRGFAVVASEVRSLAQRSAAAAKEIKGLIGASVEKVDGGTRLVADAGSTMQEIVQSVQRVSDIIGEISAATVEQNAGLGQINDSVTHLDQMTQQNAALVEESAAAAESLREQAAKLSGVVAVFHLETQPR